MEVPDGAPDHSRQEARAMRLRTRQRHGQAAKALRISISQEEITADLIYPARRPIESWAAPSRKRR
jgi:hypothetical protein